MNLSLKEKNNWYLSKFELFEKGLNGESQSPVHAIRRDAISRFTALGFPTNRNEDWRFTNVAPIAGTNFKPLALSQVHAPVSRKDIERFLFKGLNCYLLAFIDGQFSKELSDIKPFPAGVKIGSLAGALTSEKELVTEHLTRYARYTEDAFTALSTAFLCDGAFVNVPDDKTVELPIHILFVATGTSGDQLISPRNLIIAGKNSRASIIESYLHLNAAPYFTNAVTEIALGANSKIEHDKLQMEYEGSYHIASTFVQQGASSDYVSNSISLGGAIVRNNITSVLGAEHCKCTLNGLSLATGKQHVDNHTTIDHSKPNCASHELYKSILDGKARGVFNGKIFVRKDAQKTDAKQTNKTLLLSDDATIDTKPQLEIFADDVKCTHGATVGQLDEEQIFYLRARGIGLERARDMLTFAFAGDVVHRIQVAELRETLDLLIQANLRRGRQLEDAE